MATDDVPLAAGALFNSFAELKAAIDARSNALNEKLVIGRSARIVTATDAKIKGQFKYKEDLVYTSITFRCVHEGDFHSKGHIKDSRSMKIGCPVQVKVIADKVTNKLRIVHAVLQHNHVLPQKKDGVYFQDRKLSKEEEEDVENLINLGVSVRRIVDHILSSYNKPVKAKDIHNLKKKLENQQAALKAKGKLKDSCEKTRGQDGADPSSLKNGTRREILSFLEKSRKKSCGKITEVKIEQEDPHSDDADCSNDYSNSRTYQDQIFEDESGLFSDGTFQNEEPKDKLLKSEVSQKEVSENELFSKDDVSETEASLEADSHTHSDISQLEESNIEVSHNEAAQFSSTTTINLSSMKPNLSLQTSLRTRSKQPPKRKRAESDSTEEMCSTSSTSASSPVPCVVSTSAEIRIEKNDSDQKSQEERMRAANEHFGSYIAESLSSMSPQACDWCIMQINNAIYKARSGMWCQ